MKQFLFRSTVLGIMLPALNCAVALEVWQPPKVGGNTASERY
jgi:hypothetical protein